jgi:hypothetical protein
MSVERFALADEEGYRAFLAKRPRVVVLFRGLGCPYSSYFERVYASMPDPLGWARVIRDVEHAGAGVHGRAHAITVTPTVAAFRDGGEAARLEAKEYLGITRMAYARWVKSDVLALDARADPHASSE